jgi:hypothetical protein
MGAACAELAGKGPMMRLLSLPLLFIATPCLAATVHYVEVYNTARSSIVAFESAAPGTDGFGPVALTDFPLQGGGASATATFGGTEGCLRDLRIRFADGRVLLHRGFDVCRSATYHTDRYLRRRAGTTGR